MTNGNLLRSVYILWINIILTIYLDPFLRTFPLLYPYCPMLSALCTIIPHSQFRISYATFPIPHPITSVHKFRIPTS